MPLPLAAAGLTSFLPSLMQGAGLAGMGGGLFNMFTGGGADQMQEMLQGGMNDMRGIMQPWQQGGMQAQNQMLNYLNNPTSFMNNIYSQYQASPQFNLAKEDMTRAVGNAASSGGTLGTSGHQADIANRVNQLGMQDRERFYQNASQPYFSMLNQLYGGGLNSSNNLAQMMGGMYGDQASAAYQGAQNRGSGIGSMLGSIPILGGLFRN